MKKNKKIMLTVLVATVLIICSALLIIAATLSEKPKAVLNYIVGISDEMPEYADANGDGSINVLDVIALMREEKMADVRLSTLTLDDSTYSLDFNSNVLSYTVKLPAGRPGVPRVLATAPDGAEVEISQAVIPDGQDFGYAKIKVTDSDDNSNLYTVKFEKAEENGFVLQYDDRFEFSSDYALKDGETLTYVSSNSDVVAVSDNGLMHAKAVSNEKVTVSAMVGGQTVDTLVIDRVEKAHVNLFLVTGQSNAQGCYASTTANDPELCAEQLAQVEMIGRDGAVYSYDFHPRKSNTEVYKLRYTLYDMNTVAKQGFQSSLGKRWYELSGEKVVFLQTAYSGAPIQSWLDTETQPEAGKYGGRNYYDDTQQAYADLMPLLEDNYEIIRTANFWNQGGTAMVSVYSHERGDYITSSDAAFDPSKLMTDDEYYTLFMLMHEDMKRDFGIEFCGIFLNRVTPGATSAENKALQSHTDMVPIRSAQYGLHNTVPEVSLVSRVGDYAKRTTWTDKTDPGWGFVDTDNTHFTQIGYNERGRVAAENAFNIWVGDVNAESVELVAENGRDRLTSNDTIKLKEGEDYRLAGYALPEASGAKTTLTSSNPAIVSVDKYGVVRALAAGDTVITATTDNGKTASVKVSVSKTIVEDVTYRWDFNDLKATGTKNDLTLSECADYYSAGDNYSITEGVLIVDKTKASASKNRPDFKLEKSITLNNENDWSIEWRGYTYNTSCVLMGPAHDDPEGNTSKNGYIYLASTSDFDYSSTGELYPLRFVPETGTALSLSYGDYKSQNYSMNSWKLVYTKADNKMTLCVSEDEGTTWVSVSTVTAGKFSTTFETLLGRMRGNGYLNYYGGIDYIQVNFKQEYQISGTNYRWDFNDLTSSAEKNDLTVSANSVELGADKCYSLTNGIYSVSSEGSSYSKRPDFEMEKPVNVTSEKSWVIEWRGKANTYGVLMGPKQDDPVTGTASSYPFIYNYFSNKYSTATGYPLKIAFGASDTKDGNIFFDYGDYKTFNREMNTWRLSYNADTAVMALSYYNATTETWETVGSQVVDAFDMTFYSLFGRAKGNGQLNYYGDMDYIHVTIAK
ncbi:MAG: Ig-like domain-containing protein [Clostridia bacterium]|nr:Ig-like domain-containing protein [Clostridia bacterium]